MPKTRFLVMRRSRCAGARCCSPARSNYERWLMVIFTTTARPGFVLAREHRGEFEREGFIEMIKSSEEIGIVFRCDSCSQTFDLSNHDIGPAPDIAEVWAAAAGLGWTARTIGGVWKHACDQARRSAAECRKCRGHLKKTSAPDWNDPSG
jgi:hypothetical protein